MTLQTEFTPEMLSLVLSADYECLPGPREGVFVHTLCDYPDGGVIDVYVLTRDDGLLVTDHGEALGWLHMQFAAERFTSDQRTQIERVCQAKDVTLDRGRLILRGVAEADIVNAIEQVAGAIAQIAQACAPRHNP